MAEPAVYSPTVHTYRHALEDAALCLKKMADELADVDQQAPVFPRGISPEGGVASGNGRDFHWLFKVGPPLG